jgi:hypothetical protein
MLLAGTVTASPLCNALRLLDLSLVDAGGRSLDGALARRSTEVAGDHHRCEKDLLQCQDVPQDN